MKKARIKYFQKVVLVMKLRLAAKAHSQKLRRLPRPQITGSLSKPKTKLPAHVALKLQAVTKSPRILNPPKP